MRKGFTIVELLLAVGILCILAAILIPLFQKRAEQKAPAPTITQTTEPTIVVDLGNLTYRIHDMDFILDGRDFPERYALYVLKHGRNFTLLPSFYDPRTQNCGIILFGYWVIPNSAPSTQPIKVEE